MSRSNSHASRRRSSSAANGGNARRQFVRRRRSKEQKKMLAELAKGDEVVTASGQVGKVAKISDQ
ncbi:MAG: preprotein translocase subunit YajC, partial [Candidatus Thermoplasmatota archaeon]|nr:preprotein translocase subunit YajC [Candidatus Thermoplasmatota archaeon]